MMKCPKCGTESVEVHTLDKYHYRESGLDNVWLFGGGVNEYICASCGYRGIAVQKEQQLLQVIALKLLLRPALIRGQELRYLRHQFDLTQKQLATKLGLKRLAVVKWEDGALDKADHSRQLHLRMLLLREFQRVLAEEGNYLGPASKQRLDTFQRELVEKYEKIFRKPKLVLIKLEKRNDWEPQTENRAA